MIFKTIEWKTFCTFRELNAYRIYFEESEKLIQTSAQDAEKNFKAIWTPETEEEHDELRREQMEARQLHDEILSPTFRYSAIVTLQAIIEKELFRLVENLEKTHGSQALKFKDLKVYLKGNLLDRVAKFSEDFFQMRFKKCRQYESLQDLQKIRNCIVHCYGELDAMENPKHLLNLTQAKRNGKKLLPGFFAFKGASVKIEPSCVMHFTQEVWSFFTWVFLQLRWKVNDEWKKMI